MRRWWPVVVLGCAEFVMVLDSTVMNVSISAVVADLKTTVPDMQLAIASYTLVMAAFMLTGAALGDRWGRRRTMALGLAVYGVGALVTASAPNFAALMLGWVLLEGLGAVLVVPAVTALVATNYSGPARGVAFGLIGGIAGAGAAAGPILGGWVTSTFTWRAVFAAEAVLVAGLLLALRVVADGGVRRSGGRFDLVGTALSAGGIGAVVLALAKASSWGWVQPRAVPFRVFGFAPTLPVILAGLGVLVGLWRWERWLGSRGGRPLVDLGLLADPTLRAGLGTVTVQQFVLIGTFFVLPLYLQMVLDLDAFASGLRVLPLSVVVFATSLGGAALARRIAPATLIRAGLLVTVLGVVALLATIEPTLRSVDFALAMALLGAGVGLVVSQAGTVLQSTVGDAGRNAVAGLQGTVQNVGASLGTALIGTVLLTGLAAGFSSRVAADDGLAAATASAAEDQARRGLDFVTLDQAQAAVTGADMPPQSRQQIVADYTAAQLAALKAALGAVAIVGLSGLTLTRHLPRAPLRVAAPDTAAVAPSGAG